MSKVTAFYHLVINTKYRRMTLTPEHTGLLYAYMTGIADRLDTQVLAIGGIENHIHVLINLSPKISLSDFLREFKRASSIWLKAQPDFKYFESWGKEYFAASVSLRH